MKPRIRYNRILKIWVCHTMWDLNLTIGAGSNPMAAYAAWVSQGGNARKILEMCNPVITIEAPITLDHELSWWKRFSFSS